MYMRKIRNKMLSTRFRILQVLLQRPKHNCKRSLRTVPFAVSKGLLREVECSDSELQLRFDGQHAQVSVPLVWLRDSCECGTCRDPLTRLRNPNVKSLIHTSAKKNLQPLRFSVNEDFVHVTWPDGHESSHNAKLILAAAAQGSRPESGPKKIVWDGALASSLPIANVQYIDMMSNDGTIKDFLYSITKYGLALVHGVPATSNSTRQVMERMGPIWGTFWGEVYHVVADLSHFAHPSYTGEHLPLHTDTNYYIEGAGLQAFHVLEHNGDGGKNMLVDGFNVAQNLKRFHPKVYEFLSRKPVSFKYREEGKRHYLNEDFLLKHHPLTNELLQIRFTECDFDVFRTVSAAEADAFYESLTALRKEINDPKNAHWLKLNPGTVMVTDNWRVLHGRSSFTGKRVLCGMYISRSDYLSKSRLLGII